MNKPLLPAIVDTTPVSLSLFLEKKPNADFIKQLEKELKMLEKVMKYAKGYSAAFYYDAGRNVDIATYNFLVKKYNAISVLATVSDDTVCYFMRVGNPGVRFTLTLYSEQIKINILSK